MSKDDERVTSAVAPAGVARRAQGVWIPIVNAVWFAVAALAVFIFVASIPFGILPHLDNVFDVPIDASPAYVTAMSYVSVGMSIFTSAVSIGIAVLLFWRKREERLALGMSFFLLLYGVAMSGPLEWLIGTGSSLEGTILPGGIVLSESLALGSQGALFALVAVGSCIFPNGHFVPRWTRYLALAILFVIPVFVRVTAVEYPSAMNPFAWSIMALALFLMLICIYAQVYRYRRVATRLERQQTKWVVYGLLLTVVIATVEQVPYYVSGTIPAGETHPWWEPLSGISWQVIVTVLPFSFAVAVMRYRLWDIDLIVRRTLTYSLLTAILALAYFGGVVLLQQLFRALTGVGGELAIIVTTLGVAVLANPLRGRIQDTIDRRFFRHKYDAQVVLSRFARMARDETDLDKLTRNLMDIVNETIQPERVSVWLKGPGRGR